jgi:hypothetical protein
MHIIIYIKMLRNDRNAFALSPDIAYSWRSQYGSLQTPGIVPQRHGVTSHKSWNFKAASITTLHI